MISSSRLILALAVLFFFTFQSKASDELSGQEFLAVAKMAGACGILDETIHFQKTTKMKGGDEFVSRFWATEAARLGLSMQEYSDRCDQAIISYDKLWKAMQSKNE